MEAEISTSVLMIERSECSLIWAAEAKGEVIDFRPTTSPQAVLGVRLDRQPDQEAASAFNSPISWKSIGCRSRRLQFRLLPDDDLGADRNALVQVGNVGIDQPETAGRNSGADGVGPVGAVNAIHGGAEIHRPRPERIAGPAGHEARQIRLARDHLRRRRPVRPFGLARNVHQSLPLEAFAADADAIAQRAAIALDQIEMALGGDDDDGARRFVGAIEHRRLPELRIELDGIIGDQSWLVTDVRLSQLCLALRGRQEQAAGGDQRPDQVPKLRHPIFSFSRQRHKKVDMGNHQSNRQCTVFSYKSKVKVLPLNFINTIVSVRTNGYISLAAGRAAVFGDNISTLGEAVASLPHGRYYPLARW